MQTVCKPAVIGVVGMTMQLVRFVDRLKPTVAAVSDIVHQTPAHVLFLFDIHGLVCDYTEHNFLFVTGPGFQHAYLACTQEDGFAKCCHV